MGARSASLTRPAVRADEEAMSFLARSLMVARRRLLSLSTVPRIGVRLLAVSPDEHVLLVKHTYVSGWHLPGGGLKTGERADEGAIREAWEESGHRVGAVDGLLGLYANFGVGWSDHVAVYVSRDITADVDLPVRPPSRLEIAAAAMFNLDELPPDICGSSLRRIEEWRGRRPLARDW